MSSERFVEPSEQHGDDSLIMARAHDLRCDTEQRLEDIILTRPYLDSANDVHDWTVSAARELQLRQLSEFVTKLAINPRYGIAIDLEDAGFLDEFIVPNISPFAEYGGTDDKDIHEGEILGTNDFLELLAPNSLPEESLRKVYYRPWERQEMDSIIKHGYLKQAHMPSLDGSLLVSLPTYIPNIEVTMFYFPDASTPLRRIGNKRPSYE